VAAPVFFAFFFMQTKKKFPFLLFGLITVLAVLLIAPQEWWDRMQLISDYSEDKSALSRLTSWKFAWDYALEHPILGGGFKIFRFNVDPVAQQWREAHSIYFEVLGEHGFVGLVLFCTLMFGLVYSGFNIRRRCRPYPDLAWAGDLGVKLSISISLYLTSGAFLSVAFHPIAYDLAVLSIAVIHVVNREIAAREGAVRGRYPNLRLSRDLTVKAADEPAPVAAGAQATASESQSDTVAKPRRQSWLNRREAGSLEPEAGAGKYAHAAGARPPRGPKR